MTAVYYTAVALFALSCLAWLTWAVLKLIAWREGVTDVIQEIIEAYLT